MKRKVFFVSILAASILLALTGWGCKESVSVQDAAPNQNQQAETPEQAFTNFKLALASGDINAALQEVHPAGREKIAGYLDEMQKLDTLKAFVDSLDRMESIRVGESIAEYDIMEEGNDWPLTMTFMKVNGIWKIRDF